MDITLLLTRRYICHQLSTLRPKMPPTQPIMLCNRRTCERSLISSLNCKRKQEEILHCECCLLAVQKRNFEVALSCEPYLFVQIPYNNSTKAMLRFSSRKPNKFLAFLSAKINLKVRRMLVCCNGKSGAQPKQTTNTQAGFI